MTNSANGFLRQYIWTGVAGTPWYTTLYALDDVNPANFADDSNDFMEAILNDVGNAVTVELIDGTYGWDAANQAKTDFLATSAFSAIGGQTSDLLPTQTQALLSLRSGVYVGGREVRGRLYLGGYVEFQNLATGSPVPGLATNINAAWATYQGVSEPAINSPKNGLLYEVVSGLTSSQWATQRSRSARG